MKLLILTTFTPHHEAFIDALMEYRPFIYYEDVNTSKCWRAMEQAEIVMVYGTGKLTEEAISRNDTILNFHGGNPEYYRGLDSHLWAIYHNDWNLQATMHHVEPTLDTGDIVFQAGLTGFRTWEELQEANNQAAIDMALLALSAEWLPRRKQAKRGRYYGAMPEELKEKCIAKISKTFS